MISSALDTNVRTMVPRELMSPGARKLRDSYAKIPGAPIFHKEFWLMPGTLERWKQQGMPQDISHNELFGFDEPGDHFLGQLGWCEAAFQPCFTEKQIEDRGDKEVMLDFAGRHVLFF
jgi:hypothetical protein